MAVRPKFHQPALFPKAAAGTPPPGFANFDQWLSGTQLERELKIQQYSASNHGLRPQLVGTPEQIAERIEAYEDAGLDLLLLQMGPQEEEMERFSADVIVDDLNLEEIFLELHDGTPAAPAATR